MIKIGDKDREFSLDLYTFRIAHKKHGVRIAATDFSDIALGDLALYLWVGLLADNPTLSEDQVLGWIRNTDAKTQQEWLEMVVDAIGSFGQLEVEAEEEDGKKPEGGLSTGKKSVLLPTGS